eukprot:Skav222335  [mRNA]  locus=scaffold3590:46701:49343:+ [translate_table: standard]
MQSLCCATASAWEGHGPVYGEPPSAEDVLRSMARVLERPSTEATDGEVKRWIGRDSWTAIRALRSLSVGWLVDG